MAPPRAERGGSPGRSGHGRRRAAAVEGARGRESHAPAAPVGREDAGRRPARPAAVPGAAAGTRGERDMTRKFAVKVTICDEEYTVRSELEPEYTRQVA